MELIIERLTFYATSLINWIRGLFISLSWGGCNVENIKFNNSTNKAINKKILKAGRDITTGVSNDDLMVILKDMKADLKKDIEGVNTDLKQYVDYKIDSVVAQGMSNTQILAERLRFTENCIESFREDIKVVKSVNENFNRLIDVLSNKQSTNED